MADPKPPTYRAPPAPRADGSRDAFDVWLRISLRRIYDAVAAEPVPEALRQLAAAHGGRERGKAAPRIGAVQSPVADPCPRSAHSPPRPG
jgi:hypothetical protein